MSRYINRSPVTCLYYRPERDPGRQRSYGAFQKPVSLVAIGEKMPAGIVIETKDVLGIIPRTKSERNEYTTSREVE